MNTLDRASDAQPVLKSAPQDGPREAYAPSEDGISTEGSSSAEGVMSVALLEVAVAPSFLTRLAGVSPRRLRMLDQLLLSLYIPLLEWVCPSTDIMDPGLEGAREIIGRWSPFKKRDSSVRHMHDLYPHSHPNDGGGSC